MNMSACYTLIIERTITLLLTKTTRETIMTKTARLNLVTGVLLMVSTILDLIDHYKTHKERKQHGCQEKQGRQCN